MPGCSREYPERSVASTRTSVARPASIHIFAVRRPATPDAHMAVTIMFGPCMSYSCMIPDRTVEGIRLSHSFFDVW